MKTAQFNSVAAAKLPLIKVLFLNSGVLWVNEAAVYSKQVRKTVASLAHTNKGVKQKYYFS